jgi:hypothetical protein
MATAREIFLKFKAETAQIKGANQDLLKMKIALLELATSSEKAKTNVGKAFDMIGLGAPPALTKLQKLSMGFHGFTDAIGHGVTAVDKFAKGLAPWNQALELGGKAIKFADEAMGEFAKTSPKAAAEVEKVRERFGDLKDSAMSAAGALTVALLKPLPSAEELRKKLVEVAQARENAFGDKKDDIDPRLEQQLAKWNSMRGGGHSALTGKIDNSRIDTNKALGFMGRFNDELQGQLAVSGIKGITDAFKELTRVDPWANGPKLEDLFDKVTKKSAETSKVIRLDAQRWKAEWSARAEGNFTSESDINRWFDDEKATRRAGTRAELGLDGTAQSMDFGGINTDLSGLRGKVDEGSSRSATLLESAFGPIEEFDAYRQSFEALGGTFNAFSEAVAGSYEAVVTGQGSVREAFKSIAASGMLALGKTSVVQALSETALGFGSLALGPIGGASASMHFKSAALHTGVAVAAGLAAKGLGGGGSASTGAGRSASSGSSSAGGRGGSSGGISERVIVVYGDAFSEDSPRQRQLTAERLVSKALGTSAGSNR